jgi:hypothetical protein
MNQPVKYSVGQERREQILSKVEDLMGLIVEADEATIEDDAIFAIDALKHALSRHDIYIKVEIQEPPVSDATSEVAQRG